MHKVPQQVYKSSKSNWGEETIFGCLPLGIDLQMCSLWIVITDVTMSFSGIQLSVSHPFSSKQVLTHALLNTPRKFIV